MNHFSLKEAQNLFESMSFNKYLSKIAPRKIVLKIVIQQIPPRVRVVVGGNLPEAIFHGAIFRVPVFIK